MSTAVSGGGLPEKAAAALVNTFRLASVTQRLRYHIEAGGNSETKEFQICCISLAKGIDFAIANNEIPKKVEELPLLLKQVCRHRIDVYTKTAVMVLMISIKHACQLGWFPDTDSRDLTALAHQMGISFGNVGNISPPPPPPTLSLIIQRFYPFVKVGHVLLSLQLEPGYTMLPHDFHISKKMPHAPQEKIRLFVAQTDNTDTSACLINPPEVSFILNGKMVEKRVNITMDSGPQPPTNVTTVLKYGTNLLQVMGNSKGRYIIVIAFTRLVQPPANPVLKDYLQSQVIQSNPDSDIIEGPSRVSLKCPISRCRIKLPVKGQLCKHLQCFDFWNYVHINMKIPSWRCPHCNQPVCYSEIRVDQNMVKILKEAGQNAADVIIDTGGTWKVAKENDGTEEPVRDVMIHDLEDPNSSLNPGPVVLDLTGDDDTAEMELFGGSKVVDRKPHLSDGQGQSNDNNPNKDDDFLSFNISDVISLDQVMLEHMDTETPAPAPSPRDGPTATPSVITFPNPPPQLSQARTYLGGTSGQSYTSQPASMVTPSQSRRTPVPVTSQSPASLAQSPHVPRVLSSQPTSYFSRSLNSNHVSAEAGESTQRQHPSNPAVQSVTRTSDLMDLDSTTPDTTNWRPRMRGSLTPGTYSPALDHMIIRPTQQSQTRPQGSQPAQTPPAQPPFSTAPPGYTRPPGPAAPRRT